jgi:hypothetical protein
MIRIRGKGVTYGELWFDETLQAPQPDILICRQRSQPWPGAQCENFVTLLIDLTQDEAALSVALDKDHRYEIRRAATKDGGISTTIDQPAQELDAFCAFYDRFAAAKGLGRSYRKWLNEAAAADRLILTNAEHGGNVRVWHAYIVSGDRVRLLHSASLAQADDKSLQALVGRLNRWLHWQDILEFKRRGFRTYDLGGIFAEASSSAAAGINRFKAGFGGVRSPGFDCTVALTGKGRLYLALLKLRDRSKTMTMKEPA